MEILVDFQKVINQANQMEELAGELRRECEGNLAEALNVVSSAWTGTAAQKYLRKGNRFQEEMIRSANDLARTAEVMREIAQVLYAAEQAAIHLAAL